ncbi:MAG TPA: hypothetical protein VGN63_08495 [Flavisolibacter sp.]|jgi:hypothetical protein|nr:hypothetical protein [Flavisolibacter sp.]
MKKILTLLIATGAFVTLHAQSREENRRVVLGDRNENGTYSGRNDRDVVLGRGSTERYPSGTYSSNRQYEIDRVNREYNDKINSIRNNRQLNNAEKERTIRQLERDRQRRIDEINRDYNGRNDRRYDDDDRYRRDDQARNNRGDNGKHKGWYKKEKNKNWKKGKRN